MLNLEIYANLQPAETVTQLRSFFVSEGLKIVLEEPGFIRLERGRGFIEGLSCLDDTTQSMTRINISSRQWEFQVR